MSEEPLRIAVIGSGIREIDSLFETVLQSVQAREVRRTHFAGATIRQAFIERQSWGNNHSTIALKLVTCGADFIDFYRHYFAEASGIIALIPTNPEQVNEARRVFELAQSGRRRGDEAEDAIPLVLQYQWQPQHLGLISPESVDQALGIAAGRERFLSRIDHEDQLQGIAALARDLAGAKA